MPNIRDNYKYFSHYSNFYLKSKGTNYALSLENTQTHHVKYKELLKKLWSVTSKCTKYRFQC